MKIILALTIAALTGGFISFKAVNETMEVQDQLGTSPFTLQSNQLAPSPQNGYILSTNGADNSWIVNTGGSGGGLATTTPWTIGDIVEVASNGTVKSTSTISESKIDSTIARDSELHDAVTFAGTGTYISLSGQQITVDPITESDISDLTHYTDGDVSSYITGSSTFFANRTLLSPTLTSFFGTPCTGNDFLQDISDTGAFTCITATGGGGGGSLSTTTEKILAGAESTVSYLTDEFMLGGSSSTTAEFLFDYASSSMEIRGTATTSLLSTGAQEAVRIGEADRNSDLAWDIGEGIEFDFGTPGDVIVTMIGSVANWVWKTGSIVKLGTTQWNNGDSIEGASLAAGTVSEPALNLNTPTDDYILVASSSATGGFEWVATSTARLNFGAGGSGTVTSVDMTVPTGLAISGNPITTSGTLALTYDNGYAAVLTASTTNWNNFYNAPSSVITAGTGIDWTTNTLNVTLGDFSTTNLSEGTNLYYTDGRVSSYLYGSSTLSDLIGTHYTNADASAYLYGSTTINDLCISITGSADLCDGSDDGGGSSEWTDAGDYIYPNEITERVLIGTSTEYNSVLSVAATSSDSSILLRLVNTNKTDSAYFYTDGYAGLSGTGPWFDLTETDVSKAGGMFMSAGDLHLFTSNANYSENDNAIILDDDVELSSEAGSSLTMNSATIVGSLIPDSHDLYDLGASGAGWAGLWLGADECINFDGVECFIGQSTQGTDLTINPEALAGTATGLLGVGTQSPTAKLTVKGWSTDGVQNLFNVASSTGTNFLRVDAYGTTTVITASTTNVKIGNQLIFDGVTGTQWSDFCVSITGSADLCDGSDASGGGGDSAWTAISGAIYHSTTTDTVLVGTSTNDYNSKLTVVGTTTFFAGTNGVVQRFYENAGGEYMDIALDSSGVLNLIDDQAVTGLQIDTDLETLSIPQYLTHLGDANTSLRYQNDRVSLTAGGVTFIDFLNSTTDVGTVLGDLWDFSGVATTTFDHASTSRLTIGADGLFTSLLGTHLTNTNGVLTVDDNLSSYTDDLTHYVDSDVSSYLYGSTTRADLYTAGNALTWTGTTIDFDGGASPGGELGGTWGSPTIDDSLAVTSWNLTTPTFTTNFTFDGVTVTGISGVDTSLLSGTVGTTNAVLTVNADDDIVEQGLTWNITAGTCTGDGNGGALTVNGSNQIVCSADDGGGGGGGALSTTTEKILAGAAATVSYLTDEFMLGGSASTSAEFLFDYASSTMEIRGSGTTTLLSTGAEEAVRIGEADLNSDDGWDLVTGIEWVFKSATVVLRSAGTTAVTAISTALNWVHTGLVDIGGGTLEIPNGTGPTVDAVGEVALDTTDNQLLLADSGGTARVFAQAEQKLFSVTVASTSQEFVATGLLPLPLNKDGFELTQFRCYVDGGTSVVLNVTDGTNDTETITCNTTASSDTDVTTNDTFTAAEIGYLEFGTITGTPDYVTFTAYGHITPE